MRFVSMDGRKEFVENVEARACANMGGLNMSVGSVGDRGYASTKNYGIGVGYVKVIVYII